MKKITVIMMALAMAVSLPLLANAGESANLGLSVTFDASQPEINIYTEPAGPFKVTEGKELRFIVRAECISDGLPSSEPVFLSAKSLPEGAEFIIAVSGILPGPAVGEFIWTPGHRTANEYKAVFEARCEGVVKELSVDIKVLLETKIWTEPEGPFTADIGKELNFDVMAIVNGVNNPSLEAISIPEGATFYVIEESSYTDLSQTKLYGVFSWTPASKDGDKEHIAKFRAVGDDGEEKLLDVVINVTPAPVELKIWSDPEGPFSVEVGKELKFDVLATLAELHKGDISAIKLLAVSIPEGATFELAPIIDPETTPYKKGTLKWTPGLSLPTDHVTLEFKALYPGYLGETIIEKTLIVEVNVIRPQMSIEITPALWTLQNVKLRTSVENTDPTTGATIHSILNNGTVNVGIEMSYSMQTQIGILPGDNPGIDTFATAVKTQYFGSNPDWTVLPPNGSLTIAHVDAGSNVVLPLQFRAPTGLTDKTAVLDATYEFTAWPLYDQN